MNSELKIDKANLLARYSTLEAEYEALIAGVGLVDRSNVGRLSVKGKDGLDLLSRLSTNALLDVAPGHGMRTILTSNKGRIIDLALVLRQDERLMMVAAPEMRQKLVEWIDFYTFTEEVTVKDVTEETAMLSLSGPKAGAVLDALSCMTVSSMVLHEHVYIGLGDVEAMVARTDFTRLPGFDIIVSVAGAAALWGALLKAGEAVGIRPVGSEAVEAVRIEQGVPVFGKELGEEYNPLEAGLKDLVSFTKGCYVGQEVVTRLNTYQKVQKHLVTLRWDASAKVATNSPLMLDGKQVGVVTSAARLPGGAGVGLGYVRKAQAEPGMEVVGPEGIVVEVGRVMG